MKFMQRSLMGLFLLSLTVGLLALAGGSVFRTLQESWAEEQQSRPARERVFAVNVQTVNAVTAEPTITAFGEIRSRRTLDLRAPANGTIIHLSERFTEGGIISTGELLLRLDPADDQSALDIAKTEFAEAEAEQTEAGAALILAKDELSAAHAQTALRLAALERQKNLLKREVGTESAVESAALSHSSAQQAVLGKRQALAQAEARINRAQTQRDRRLIQLNEAERQLQDTELFATFDGVLSGTSTVVGGLVTNNEKIGSLIDPTSLEADFRVSNTQFSRLIAGNDGQAKGDVTVLLDLLGEQISATGKIERVSAEVGEGLTGRRLFASLPENQSNMFRPGDFVTVTIAEPPIENVAVIPAAAVDSAGQVLLIGEDDRLSEVMVEVLRKQRETVIVRSVDILGREIVSERSPLLGAGIKVKPVRKDTPALEEPDMVELTPERRAKLIAFVEGNARMPKDAKERVLNRLRAPKTPASMVERIESRMGG